MRSENVQSFGIGLQSDDEKIQQQHIINDNRKLVTAIFNRAECWKSGSVLDVNARLDCECGSAKGNISGCKSDCPSNFTLLHGLIRFEMKPAVKMILDCPLIDVNAKDGFGNSAIMNAVIDGRLDLVRLLVLSRDDIDLDTTDNQGMTLKDRALAEWKGEKGIAIVHCLEEFESQQEPGDLGRNARRKRKKEKRKMRKNEEKANKTEEAPESLLGDAEKMMRKISLLQVEEQAEKEKVNYALINETKTLLVLAKQFEATDLEKVALEDEMEEIGNAMNLLLRRKSSVSEKQKAVETKVAAIENEQTILKQNMAAQVHESESKIALIQGEIAIAKSSLKKSDCKTKTEEKGGNRDLENFLEGQILELEGELECPVCLEVAATSPIYKCSDDHLLCRFQKLILASISNVILVTFRECRPKLTHCPQCRVALGDEYKRQETFTNFQP